MTTTALIVILHEPNLLPKLLRAWDRAGVPGVTILPSMGGFQAQKQVNRSGLGSILNMFSHEEPGQRTLMSLVDEPETLARAISEADRVVKGFDSPRSGILFTIPIDNVLGLQKWRQTPAREEPEEPTEKETSNLLKWFQEDIKEAYGRDALTDWSSQRNLQAGQIIKQLSIEPIIVRVDTPLHEVLSKFFANPMVASVCVTNTEDRLMGLISITALAEVMMTTVVPEAYIDDPDEYEKALRFHKPDQELIAADIMSDPVYAMMDANLLETYQRMKEKKLSGLPVVNQFYHIKGYITLQELLAACFLNEN